MKNIVCMAAIVAASSGAALAADFRAAYTGIDPNATTVSATGFTGGIQGGYMNHNHDGASRGSGIGQFQNQTFQTFCIELQTVTTGQRDWHVVDIATAPNPGAPTAYGAAVEARVHAVIAAAIWLGWIGQDLSGASSDQATAIQGGVWAAIGAAGPIGQFAVDGNSTVDALWATLWNRYNSNQTETVSGLRAMTNRDSQDMLYVVPLPPAAFAGLATLVGIAGVSRLRRR